MKTIDEIFLDAEIEKIDDLNLDKKEKLEYKKLKKMYEVDIPYSWDIERIIKKLYNYFAFRNVA